MGKVGRNQKCPCGSDKKYKHCCGITKPIEIKEDSDGHVPSDFVNPKCSECGGVTGISGFRTVEGEKIPILCRGKGCSLDQYIKHHFAKNQKPDGPTLEQLLEAQGEVDATDSNDRDDAESTPELDGVADSTE